MSASSNDEKNDPSPEITEPETGIGLRHDQDDKEEDNLAIVPANTVSSNSLSMSMGRSGQVGILVIGDSAWYQKKLKAEYDSILEVLDGGNIPTYVAVKNLTVAAAKKAGDLGGAAVGSLVAAGLQNLVELHAPFLSCMPILGDIMKMVTEVFPNALVKNFISQGISAFIDLSLNASSRSFDAEGEYLQYGEIGSIMSGSAFMALIETNAHFRFGIHFQFVGRVIANIFASIYNHFFKRWVEWWLKTESGKNIVEFLDQHFDWKYVNQQFKLRMEGVTLKALKGYFDKLYQKVTAFITNKFNEYRKTATDTIKGEVTKLLGEMKKLMKNKAETMYKIIANASFETTRNTLIEKYEAMKKAFLYKCDEKLREKVEHYKLKWMIQIGYMILDPQVMARGDYLVGGPGETRDKASYLARCLEIAKDGLGEDPEYPKPDPDIDQKIQTVLSGEKATRNPRGLQQVEPTDSVSCMDFQKIFNWWKSREKKQPPSRQIQLHSKNIEIVNIADSPILEELDRFLGVNCAKVVEPFLILVSKMSGLDISDKLSNLKFNGTVDPETNVREVLVQLGKCDNGHHWTLCVHIIETFGATICILRNGSPCFELPSIEHIFELLRATVSLTGSLGESIPAPILEIGKGFSLNGLAFFWPLGETPSMMWGIRLEFDKESGFARELGLKDIHLTFELSFLNEGVFLNVQSLLSIGKIRIAGTMPFYDQDPFVFHLVTDEDERVTIDCLTGIGNIGNIIDDTGFFELADNNTGIESLHIGLGRRGVEFFDVAVASTINTKIGKVEIKNPFVSLSLESPFRGNDRSASLFYTFSLKIGSSKPVKFSGALTCHNKKLSGAITGVFMGSFGIDDILSLSNDDMPPDLELTDDMKISFDLSKLQFSEPSLSFTFGEERTMSFDSSLISATIGGPEKLVLECSFPAAAQTNDLLDTIGFQYTRRLDGGNQSSKKFYTYIVVQGNDIENGLKLLGSFADSIIERERLRFSIEKRRRKTRVYFPNDALIPSQIVLGGDEKGLTLSEMNGFISPRRRLLSFGFEAKLELDLIGLRKITLEGALVVSPRALEGSLAFTPNDPINIGKHIRMVSFAIEFAAKSTPPFMPTGGGRTDFELFDLADENSNGEGTLELIMGFTPPAPPAPPVPYPEKFVLSYPGELSIKGIIDIFLGEGTVSLPHEIGRLFVIKGPIEENCHSDLIVEFDVIDVYFRLEWYGNLSIVGQSSLKAKNLTNVSLS